MWGETIIAVDCKQVNEVAIENCKSIQLKLKIKYITFLLVTDIYHWYYFEFSNCQQCQSGQIKFD